MSEPEKLRVKPLVAGDLPSDGDVGDSLPEDERLLLSAPQRKACQLIIEGYTYEAVAETLQVAQRTIRNWVGLPVVRRYLTRLIDQEEQLFSAHRAALQHQSVEVCREILTERERTQNCSDDDWAKIQRVRADVAKTILGWAAKRDELEAQTRHVAAFGAGLATASIGVQRLPEGGLSQLIRESLGSDDPGAASDFEPLNAIDLDADGNPQLRKPGGGNG